MLNSCSPRRPGGSPNCATPCGAIGTSACVTGRQAWAKQDQDSTTNTHTLALVEAITVTDPAHPLCGLTLPCLGLATRPRIGRVCIVSLHPGIHRPIPLASTNLAPVPVSPSPCRLSIPSARALLAVLASVPVDRRDHTRQEETNDATATARTTTPLPDGLASDTRPAPPGDDPCPTSALGDAPARDASAVAPRRPTDRPGGTGAC